MAGYILYSLDEEKKKEAEVLEAQVKEKERDLQKEYQRLGEAYFEQNKRYSDVPAEFSELFNAIKEQKAAIDQCKEKIRTLKNTKRCPHCGREIPRETIYCIMCGEKVQESQPQKMENTVKCKYCGTILPAGSKFCGYCSNSLVDDDNEDEHIEEVKDDYTDDNEDAHVEEVEDNYIEDNEEDYTEEVEDSYIENSDDNYASVNNAEEEESLYATKAANTEWDGIKICPRCHKKLKRSSKFCTDCGERLTD